MALNISMASLYKGIKTFAQFLIKPFLAGLKPHKSEFQHPSA
jgi:hypothetical protein